jgi:hypothetical protein
MAGDAGGWIEESVYNDVRQTEPPSNDGRAEAKD